MTGKRKSLPVDVRKLVLHEAGYRCANPVCRHILTLDIHHLEYVSQGGQDTPDNLVALCPNCHSLHHHGTIPTESLRAWKMTLLTLNEAFDKRSIDILLALSLLQSVDVTGDTVVNVAALIASRLVRVMGLGQTFTMDGGSVPVGMYRLLLSEKGRLVIDAWKRGDQEALTSVI